MSMIKDKNNRYHFRIVIFAATLGVLISLIWFIHDSSNYQEIYNLHLSATKITSIYKYGSNDDPMPLYFILLHWFNDYIGHPSLYLDRLISLLAYVLLVIVAYFIGLLATNKSKVGLFAALLIAFSPFMLWYQ